MGFCLIKKQYKKDQGTQDLGLMCSGTPPIGVKGRDVLRKRVQVEVQEFLVFLFVRVEGIFGIVT